MTRLPSAPADKLTTAGETTHKRINGFHTSIQFPKMIFHRTLAGRPASRLLPCHGGANTSRPVQGRHLVLLLRQLLLRPRRRETLLRTHPDRLFPNVFRRRHRARCAEPEQMTINRSVRDNGLLFQYRRPEGRAQERADARRARRGSFDASFAASEAQTLAEENRSVFTVAPLRKPRKGKRKRTWPKSSTHGPSRNGRSSVPARCLPEGEPGRDPDGDRLRPGRGRHQSGRDQPYL